MDNGRWSFTVPHTARTEFAAALAAAKPAVPPALAAAPVGVDEDVASAKELIAAFAERTTEPFVSASASGHALVPGEAQTGTTNSLEVSVASYAS